MFNFLSKRNAIVVPSVPVVETKAINNQLTGTVSSIYSDFPSSVRLPDASPDVLNYIRGYASACISLISQSVADMPYYLYRVENARTGKYLGKSLKVHPKTIQAHIKKSITMGDYSLSKIFEHPFLSVLEENNDLSVTEFFSVITQYLLAIGNAYIAIERNNRGVLTGLKVLMAEYVSIKYDKDYKIVSYVYSPLLGASSTTIYNPDEILHLATKEAGSLIVGKGRLEHALLTVSISEETKKFTNCLLTNSMTPANLIVVKNSIKSETEATRIKDKFIEQFGGYNRGKSAVVFGDINVEPITTNLTDQKTIELNEFCRKEVCAIFGVPSDLLSTENSNRATITAAKEHFLKLTVFPLANTICEQITKFITKEYDNSFLLSYDITESIEVNQMEQADLYQKYIQMGIMTPEEVKAKLGIA